MGTETKTRAKKTGVVADIETCGLVGMAMEDTGFGYTLSILSGKYKMTIMYWLSIHNPAMRFNELKRRIGTISFRSLSLTLKEMEADGLVIRTEYPQVPPKVEYSLSDKGKSLIPILDDMCEWGVRHRPRKKRAAARA